ncbi:hypothetical protein LJC61_02670 [Ruminococcaceae bacterium OttesenSCG-928-A16]|nr:hypothetical protein [Ruminococcaceae bacterium OttesenSCG-928-A16]
MRKLQQPMDCRTSFANASADIKKMSQAIQRFNTDVTGYRPKIIYHKAKRWVHRKIK